jgi:hypothetical protein
MDAPERTDELAQSIDDAVRRIGRHRAMMAQMASVQVQALNELKGLLKSAGGLAAGGTTPAEVDEEIRTTGLIGDLIAGRAGRSEGPERPLSCSSTTTDDAEPRIISRRRTSSSRGAAGAATAWPSLERPETCSLSTPPYPAWTGSSSSLLKKDRDLPSPS